MEFLPTTVISNLQPLERNTFEVNTSFMVPITCLISLLMKEASYRIGVYSGVGRGVKIIHEFEVPSGVSKIMFPSSKPGFEFSSLYELI